MSAPANWWHVEPTSTAPPRQAVQVMQVGQRPRRPARPVEWMRPDVQPVACTPLRPRRALRVADGMVLWGERLALILVGLCLGSALVALVNAVVLGGVS